VVIGVYYGFCVLDDLCRNNGKHFQNSILTYIRVQSLLMHDRIFSNKTGVLGGYSALEKMVKCFVFKMHYKAVLLSWRLFH
jgi:hypothetical protein